MVSLPPFFLITNFFDLLEGKLRAMVDAGAAPGRFVPVGRGGQIAIPERPGAALIGADGIDGTGPLAIWALLQKDAVSGGVVFDDADAEAGAFQKALADVGFGHTQIFGQHGNFFGGCPDIAFIRPGATVAAARTFKL